MTHTRTPARPPTSRKPPASLEPQGRVKLTGRGAVVSLFVFCFLILLIAAWTGWDTLAGAAFVCGCGVVTCYTRASGLRTMVVCPPLLFLAGAVCAQALTAAGGFMAAEGVLVMLGTGAPWLFTGTALTMVIAIGRGYRPTLPGMAAIRNLADAWRRRLAEIQASPAVSWPNIVAVSEQIHSSAIRPSAIR